jgi:hypothetical protein
VTARASARERHRHGRPRGRLRAIASWALVVAAGAVLGVASAWAVLRDAGGFGAAAGPWRVSLLAGSTEAGPWTRARVAIGGLLALNRDETMYYVAGTDSAGRPLRSRCTYRVAGTPPPARWWSVTAYADDFFLFDAPNRRYSVNGDTVRLDAAGRFAFVSGPVEPAGTGEAPWVPTPGDRGLLLTLRVYNPQPSLQAAPTSLDPPSIERVGACP